MTQGRPVFHIFGTPVFFPPSMALGLLLIGWFALPTAQSVLGEDAPQALVLGLAVAHAAALYFVIFAHEFGHVQAAKHYGYPVRGIVLHVIGGHTDIGKGFTRARHQGVVALSGTLASLVLAALMYPILMVDVHPALNSVVTWTLWMTAIMAIINLLPGYPLDGGAILSSIVWRFSRVQEKGRITAARSGFVVAALWASSPFMISLVVNRQPEVLDIVISSVLGLWLASNCAEELRRIRNAETPVRDTVVQPWQNYIRKTITVEPSLPVSAVLDRMTDEKAGAVLLVDSHSIAALVVEAAVRAVPQEQRAHVSILKCARRVLPGDFVSEEMSAEELFQDLASSGTTERIVQDVQGAIIGVITKFDIPAQLNRTS